MLRTRLISIAALAPLVVAGVIVGGWLWTGICAVAILLATHEYLHLVRADASSPQGPAAPSYLLGMMLAVLWIADARWPGMGLRAWGLALAALAPLAAQVIRGGPEGSLNGWALTVAGTLYVGYALSHWVLLRDLAHGLDWTAIALAGTWSSDAGAYLIGRAWGRRPFFPSISPKKTLEGAVGGMVLSVLGTVAAALLLPVAIAPWQAFVLGLLISIAAPLGDLAESVIKRQTGAKDAGRLIPGHGGMLDRLDSLIFVGPLAYYVVTLFLRAG